MYSMIINYGGQQRTVLYSQYIKFFNGLKFQPPLVEACSLDDKTVPSNYLSLKFDINKDRPNKNGLPEAKLIDALPQLLLHNPNIAEYSTRNIPNPSTSTNKQHQASVNLVSEAPVLFPSPARSLSGENATLYKLNSKKIGTEEIKNDSKRNASPSPTRSNKVQKLFETESLKWDCKEKATHFNNIDKVNDFNQVLDQVEKINSSKCIKTNNTTMSSPLNSTNGVSLETASPKLTNKKQPTNIDLNCSVNSINFDFEKEKCESSALLKNEGLNLRKNSQDLSEMLRITYNGDIYDVTNPQTINSVIKICEMFKQNDLKKHHVPNNQQYSSIDDIFGDLQLNPSSTKQLLDLKSSVACQSSPQDLKKCTKCNAPSKNDTCTMCGMSADLKEVSPQEDDVFLVISDDEDDTSMVEINCTSEPAFNKTESQDVIKKHIDKLSLNPKLLEDKLQQMDLSADDYFKFENCHSINIGSFFTLPASSSDPVICMHGIRMTIKDCNCDPVTIDVSIDNIMKILGFYTDQYTILLIYTNYLASVGIRHLLNMKEDNTNYYYNPLSKNNMHKRIIWTLELSKSDIKKLEKLLLRFNNKYEPLGILQIKAILSKTGEGEDNKYKAKSVTNKEVYENPVILRDKIDNRTISVLRISDYRRLQIGEYMNDVLIEFYLNWWYVRKLSEKDRSQSYLFNSHFYFKLTNKAASESTSESKAKTRYSRVNKWTRKVDIFEKDFIFIPINKSSHWFMAVICFPHLLGPVDFDNGTPVDVSNIKPVRPDHPPIKSVHSKLDEADGNIEDLWEFKISYSHKSSSDYETDVSNLQNENRPPIKQPCILIFDSLNGGVARARIVATLREWLAEEYKSKHNGAEKDFSPASMKGAMVKVPQQPNSVDCGLFVCHYFEKFFERPIVDYHCPIMHLENWFPSNEVSTNCQKRKQIQSVIQDMIKEQGGLPPNITLPTLNFSPPVNLQLQHLSQNHSRNQYHTIYDGDKLINT